MFATRVSYRGGRRPGLPRLDTYADRALMSAGDVVGSCRRAMWLRVAPAPAFLSCRAGGLWRIREQKAESGGRRRFAPWITVRQALPQRGDGARVAQPAKRFGGADAHTRVRIVQ